MFTIIVCLKFTVDTAQLKADSDTGAPRLETAPLRISTFDEHALEAAVRIREARGGKVMTLTLAPERPPEELLLRVLAMGADESHLILEETCPEADSLATARVLASGLEKLKPWNLVICGEGSLDGFNRQVGPRLGEALKLPVLTHTTGIEVGGDLVSAVVDRAVDERIERVLGRLPMLVTVGQEINQPRFPTVLQIMASSRKPIVVWKLPDLDLEISSGLAELAGTRVLEIASPADERRKVVIPGDSAEEKAEYLARKLLEEGLVRRE